jgi:transposase
MNIKTYTYFAVDVSSQSLETLTNQHRKELDYTTRAIKQIIKEAQGDPNMVVVLEATGGYERKLLDALHAASVPCVRINPGRVRDFARSEGVKAKTDRIDASMILRFAQEKKLQPVAAPTEEQKQLAALMDRRSQLGSMLTEEKNRLQNSPLCIHADIRGSIRSLKLKIKKIEQRIHELIEKSASFRQGAQIIQSVKGVGPVTTAAILAYLPEITRINRNQLAALAGVAPFNRDSGNKSGKRSIYAGRSKVRNPLYMAAVCAARCNPVIQIYVQGLKKRGKPSKCALVAAMRKLLIHIQSELRKHQYAA